MKAGQRRFIAWTGLVVSILAVVAAIAVYASDTVEAASDLDDARREYGQLVCLGELGLSLVPDDAVVFVERPEGSRNIYWWQRMIELTAPERWVTGNPDEADVIMTLVRQGGPCDGVGLAVAKP